MSRIKVKIHDVMHDRRPDDPRYTMGELEDRIEDYILEDSLKNIRIASGPQNSPIFFELETNTVSADHIKSIARQIVREFGKHVDGVDVDRTIRDDNIRISPVED